MCCFQLLHVKFVNCSVMQRIHDVQCIHICNIYSINKSLIIISLMSTLPIYETIQAYLKLIVTAWLVLRRNSWWSCAILLAQPSVDNVFGRLLVVTSLFRGFGFRHSAIGPSLSQAPKFGTLSRSGSDNRVTIYCFSNGNWKRICFSSSERFCGSISNKTEFCKQNRTSRLIFE